MRAWDLCHRCDPVATWHALMSLVSLRTRFHPRAPPCTVPELASCALTKNRQSFSASRPLNRQTLTLCSSGCIRLDSGTFFTFVASFGSRYVCLAFKVLDSDLELFELVLHLCDLVATRQQFALFCSSRLSLGEACERKQSAKVLLVEDSKAFLQCRLH